MQITNIHSAKTHLSRLIERVIAGEEIVIGRSGKPVAKLVPYSPAKGPRKPGGKWRGKIKMSKDFDRLPDEVIQSFYDEEK